MSGKIRRRKAIIFATTSMVGGGAERAVLLLCNACKLKDYQTVLLLAEARGPYLREVASHVEVVSVGIAPRLINTVRFIFRLKSLLRVYSIAGIVSHLTDMNLMLLRGLWLGVIACPVVVVEQNNLSRNWDSEQRSWLRKRIFCRQLRWLYSKAERVCSVSRGVALDVAERIDRRFEDLEVIHNPVNIDLIEKVIKVTPTSAFYSEFVKLPRPIIIGAGRLHPQKGFTDLISAFGRISKKFAGTLVIMGEGPLRKDLESRIVELGIEGRVYLPGFLEPPWPFIAGADVFVLSSHWEGFPLIVMEAMACRTPVVATNCPFGPSEIIEDRVNGFLVPVGDVPRIAEGICLALDLGGKRETMTQKALSSIQKFRPERIVDQYSSLLKPLRNLREREEC